MTEFSPRANGHNHEDVASDGHRVANSSESINWYSQGQSTSVEVNGVQVAIRFVCRKGRRARIAITAPAGAKFRDGQIKDS